MSPKAHLDRSNPCIYGMKRQIIPLLSPWKGCFPPPPPLAPNISSGDGFLEPIYTPGWREAQTIKNTLYDTKYA